MPKRDGLTALELHALKIAGKGADKRRNELEVGTGQTVDFTVHISGAIGVGDDVSYGANIHAQMTDVLAVCLANAGPTARKRIKVALIETYASLEPDQENPEVKSEHLKEAEQVLRMLVRTKKKDQRGGVNGSLKVTKLSGLPRQPK
jgi:hypothetical protein